MSDAISKSGTTESVNLTVQLFSLLREKTGEDRISISLASRATGHDLLRKLAVLYPEMSGLLSCSRLASEECYLTGDEALSDGDTVLLIPPVSGG